jgi:hypothetical protein
MHAPAVSDYDQARALLDKHRGMQVGIAIDHAGAIGDAIATCAFEGQQHWEYHDVLERIERLRTFTMTVGHWLGRYHSPRAMA